MLKTSSAGSGQPKVLPPLRYRAYCREGSKEAGYRFFVIRQTAYRSPKWELLELLQLRMNIGKTVLSSKKTKKDYLRVTTTEPQVFRELHAEKRRRRADD